MPERAVAASLSRGYDVFQVVGPIFMLVVGGVGFAGVLSGSDQFAKVFVSCWMVGVLATAWHGAFRAPRRIEASDAGLRFVARSRTVDVPWASLRSVKSRMGEQMIWRWDGGRLRTQGRYEGMHRLLRVVEERAPGAELRGL